jgi:hypothetical protein
MARLAGRRHPYTDLRTLDFGRYNPVLDREGVRAPSTIGLDYTGQIVTEEGTFPLTVTSPLGNDEFLTCVPAAMLRLSQVWRAVRGKDEEPTDAQALALYEAVSPFQAPAGGKADVPEGVNAATFRAEKYRDYGTTMLEPFKAWKNFRDRNKFTPSAALIQTGTTDALAPASAFLEIEPGNVQQVKDAIYLCQGALIGLNLPRTILDEDGEPVADWYVPSYGPVADATPGTWGSHCVLALGYTDRVIHFVAWNRLFTMSIAFLLAFTQEVWCVVPADPIGRLDSLLNGTELRDMIDRDLERAADPRAAAFSPQAVGRFWGGPNITGAGT